MTNRKVNVAVVGATGAVGQAMIQTLVRRNFPYTSLKLLASARSAGQQIAVGDQWLTVEEATPEVFEGIDIALFSAGGDVSLRLAPEAVKRGALVIDNTSAFRMHNDVPLVVPEVNAHAIDRHQGIIANPNCSTIQMVVALKPLYDHYGISRVIVSTYQAASGAGAKAIEDLLSTSRQFLQGENMQAHVLPVSKLPNHYPLGFNVLPQIDVFEENGFTKEEMKMVNETRKIFEDNSIAVTPTAVRVPVVYGHSEAVYVETKKPFVLDDVKTLLQQAQGVIVQDDPQAQLYPQAIQAAGELEVFVGRIRQDLDVPNGLSMWVVADNILKGAAWNAIQIAEIWLSKAGL